MGELFDVFDQNSGDFLSGFWVTARLVGGALVLSLLLGTLIAAFRVAPSKTLNRIGGVYVETFRNLPLLVLLFISFAGLRRAGVPIGQWTAGIGALGVYTGAYVAEALRSGVFAVGQGQTEAGLSLGYTYAQTLRRIVLPQAARTVIAPLGSVVIAMIKNSAVVGVSIIALPDLLKQARVVQSRTLETNEVFFWAAVGYLLLTGLATFAFRRLERRYAIRR